MFAIANVLKDPSERNYPILRVKTIVFVQIDIQR